MACSGAEKKQAASKIPEPASTLPKITLLSSLADSNKPKVVLLDTAPGPAVIPVTKRVVAARFRNSARTDTSQSGLVADAEGKGFFTNYTTDEGLALDQVYCSYKDKWGNLWFGTNGGGVSKYNGKNYITYTTAQGLANNVIWCITQDHSGNLWFGTDGGGASKYDGERFTTYTTAQGLPGNVIFSMAEDRQHHLWFGTLDGGASRYDGKTFTNYSTAQGLAGNTVKNIIEDSKGNLWMGTLGGGVSSYDGRSFTNYTTKAGLAEDSVWSIAEDNNGALWFGTETKGVSKYDGRDFTSFNLFPHQKDNTVLCITKDKSGTLWFGTLTAGIIKYDGERFVKYSAANGLANNEVRTITNDEKGNLWVGSFGGGVSKFGGNSFTNFTTAQGLPGNVVFSIEEDEKGTLWLGTSGNGAGNYNGKNFINFTKADGLAGNEIYCICRDHQGNLWFGTSGGGVSKYDGKTFTNFTTRQGLANDIIFSIVEDRKGNLWFGTSGGGVSRYDGKSFTTYTVVQGLVNNVVFSIAQDKQDNLWFGTLGGGVSKFDGAGFTNYTVNQGLCDNVVWAITEDKSGNIWFGTQHGLTLMPKENNIQSSPGNKADNIVPQPLFLSFKKEDGLPDNFITQVIQGDENKLYIGTNLGMCELLPSKNRDSSRKGWVIGKTFNTQHGYPVKDVNAGLRALFKDSKGIIWMGTGSDKTGLVRFEPAALPNDNSMAPDLFINQVKINNEAVSWNAIHPSRDDDSVSGAAVVEEVNTYERELMNSERDSLRKKFAGITFDGITKWQPLPQKLVLPYYFNNVSFDFGAVETGQNFLVNYTYFLEGYDKEWSPPGHNTSANFGNIFEGRYTFMVKAQGPEGVWGAPVSYSFTILPPWWRTWWMFTLYGVLLILSIVLFSRWRHRRVLYQKKILEYKVAVATKQVREETEKAQVQKRKAEDALSELQHTQKQLIQAEKMASLGELTAGIAHEIQNPLNFVNNFSEVNEELLLEMKDEMDKGNVDDVKAIADAVIENEKKIGYHGKRADAIVKGMLQHSRSSGQKEPTDINALCDEYLRLAYHGLRAKDKSFNATLKTEYDESIGAITLIPQDVGRVVLNLLTNAFYAVTEKKATATGTSYEPTVSVTTKKRDGKVEITVADNGAGIPPAILEKIFQPFFTTKPTGQGTGLGLSMSYDIITKGHGGELKVASTENEGTRFIIVLPV